MEGLLVGAASVAVLVGLGALLEAALHRWGGTRQKRVSP
jgi:hypothetical protein